MWLRSLRAKIKIFLQVHFLLDIIEKHFIITKQFCCNILGSLLVTNTGWVHTAIINPKALNAKNPRSVYLAPSFDFQGYSPSYLLGACGMPGTYLHKLPIFDNWLDRKSIQFLYQSQQALLLILAYLTNWSLNLAKPSLWMAPLEPLEVLWAKLLKYLVR